MTDPIQNSRKAIVYRDCVGTCQSCGTHELVEGWNLCDDCVGELLHRTLCPLCRQPIADCHPPKLGDHYVCGSCWEQEQHRRAS